MLALCGARALRFERQLARAQEAPAALERRVRFLAAAMGLPGAPGVRVVAARISPMLWFRPGRLEVLFPSHLLLRLREPERDALLAHELAHVLRRDHWVRWLELAAAALFWWYPVVWWARSAMRRAEERSCDAWVVRTLPGHARDYARGLLKTAEFLSPAPSRLPALASGARHFHRLEERLTMILSHRISKPTTRTQRFLLALAAAAALLVSPTLAEREPPPAPPEAPAAPAYGVAAPATLAPAADLAPAPVEAPAPPGAAPIHRYELLGRMSLR